MCNQEQGKPVLAICSCFAKFYQCEDDIISAYKHVKDHINIINTPNHRWTFVSEFYLENLELYLREKGLITCFSDISEHFVKRYLKYNYVGQCIDYPYIRVNIPYGI